MLNMIKAALRIFDVETGPHDYSLLVRRKLYMVYIICLSVAVAVSFLLFQFGIEMTPRQIHTLYFRIGPVAFVLVMIVDLVAIRLLFEPVARYIRAQAQGGETAGADLAAPAMTRALNLPLLTVLRIEFLHIPAAMLSVLVMILLFNKFMDFQLPLRQYIYFFSVSVIFGKFHSIAEYFLVMRVMRPVAGHIRERAGLTDYRKKVYFISTRVKLMLVFSLIAVVPMLVFAIIAIMRIHTATMLPGPLNGAALVNSLILWALLFIVISVLTSLLVAYLESDEIVTPIDRLLEALRRVEQGDFTGRLDTPSTDEFADLFQGVNTMMAGLRERESIKNKFGKYVPRQVLDDILQGEASLGGDEKNVTVLFSDIRNYTQLAGRLSPENTVRLLNDYFTEMVGVIEAHHGVLDKYIGDAVMAVFGAPVKDPDHAEHAVRAAMDMRTALEKFNRTLQDQGRDPIETGIGISTGTVLVGNIGSASRMEFTVIGDAVNLASRLESLTKETDAKILISESTYQVVKENIPVRDLGEFDVKGMAHPCRVYGVDASSS